MKIDSAGSMSERSENMSDLIEKINAIPHLYRGKGCTDEQLAAAQEALGMTFPPEYPPMAVDKVISFNSNVTTVGKLITSDRSVVNSTSRP